MRVLQVFNRYLDRGGEEMSVERVASSLGTKHLVFHCYFDSMDFKARGHSPGSLVVQAARMLYNRDSVARFKQQIGWPRPSLPIAWYSPASRAMTRRAPTLTVPCCA